MLSLPKNAQLLELAGILPRALQWIKREACHRHMAIEQNGTLQVSEVVWG